MIGIYIYIYTYLYIPHQFIQPLSSIYIYTHMYTYIYIYTYISILYIYVCIYDSIIYPDPQFCLRPMWFNITSQVQRELGLDYAFANTLEVDETTGEDDSAQVSSLFESIDWLKGKIYRKTAHFLGKSMASRRCSLQPIL